jgi:Ca-activated chloride channel homolog
VAPDPETMRQIAKVSGGRAFQAENADDVSRIYENLGSQVATKKEQREITVAFAASGGLLLAAAAAFGLRATARLP